MTIQILRGRIDAYESKVNMEKIEDRNDLDRQRAYIVPESHHLYEFLREYFERREEFESCHVKE